MAVLSVCRALVQARTSLQCSRRFAGHGRILPMRPSQFHWKKFKDLVHLYFMVGAIPLFVVHLYITIFYGEARLAEIPEGYQPEAYEYERNPYARFVMKYIAADEVTNYERRMDHLTACQEKKILQEITKRVKNIMSFRNDYQAWYYKPVEAKHLRRAREDYRTLNDQDGEFQDRV